METMKSWPQKGKLKNKELLYCIYFKNSSNVKGEVDKVRDA